MFINKEAQSRAISIFIILLVTSFFVIAANESFFNSTEGNQSEHDNVNATIEINQTSLNETQDNETSQILIDNESLETNQSSITETEEEIDLKSIAEQYKNKLNKKTKEYLKGVEDKKEKKDYIIKFKVSVDEDKLDNLSLKKEHAKFNAVTVKGNAEDMGKLLEDSDIEYLELDQNIETLSDNVPYGIDKTNAPKVWNATKGDGVKVAILDTGISPHSDLYVVDGTSIVSDDYDDNHGHGTSIAGVLSAIINDKGLIGVSPEADIYAVKIMEGSSGDLSDAIEGVEWSINNNIDIISMSFGMETYSQIFREVLEEAYEEGILLISASGNDGGNNILYPAAYTDVIAVGAVDKDNEKASFSNYGFELELVAAGVDINSTSLNKGYAVHSGTSLAVPHVAGVAALIKTHNNSLTNEQIRAKLRNDALDLGENGKDDYYGYGLVQVNLESSDYTLENLSYFYEVFNITNYGTAEEEYIFWLDGTGTIDDVTFSEGYYLVKRYIDDKIYENKYRVDENGTLKLLWSVGFHDDFTTESSSSSDGKGWINNILNLYVDDPSPYLDAECYDFDDNGAFEDCYYDDIDALSDCANYSGTLGGNGHVFYELCGGGEQGWPHCNEGIGNNHGSPNRTTIGQKEGNVVIYEDCDNSQGELRWDEISESYFIFDKKRALCTGSTTLNYQGRETITPYWNTYKSTTCSLGYICDYDLDEQEVSTKTGTIPSPCVSDTSKCNGTITVNSYYLEGDPVNGSYVNLNGDSNGTTNANGQKILGLDLVTCGEDQNISVYCYNNQSKLCGTQKASVDFNGDSDSLFFDCNLCESNKNLKIEINDISLELSSGNEYTITTTVHTQNVETSNLNVTIKGQNKNTGLISIEDDDIISTVTGSNDYNATITINLNNIDYLHAYVDPDNKVTDEPEDDNYVLIPVVRHKLKANLSINTKYPKVDAAIKNYLKFFIDDVSQSQASAVIAIGKNTNERIDYNSNTLNLVSNPFGVSGSQIDIKTGSVKNVYAGVIGSYLPVASKPIVFIYGNRIEGTIAALKEFISARDVFLVDGFYSSTNINKNKLVILDDYDTSAIGVFDLMHNDENGPAFSDLTSQDFADVVTRILNDNNFEISIKTVKTTNDNTTLRLKHANTDYSSNYTDAIVETQKPVVLARGLWSNLLTWEDFAKELANEGRDSWLIEITGGPGQDCDTCPNYEYEDLVDYYWPGLIAGVEYYSGQNTIDYVGFSNGCRVALDSLKNWSSSGKNNAGYCFNTETGLYDIDCDLASDPVSTFVGVGCPGAFNGSTIFSDIMNEAGQDAINNLNSANTHHVSLTRFSEEICRVSTGLDKWRCILKRFLSGDGPVSLNLLDKYYNFINSSDDLQPGDELNLNKLTIIYGDSSGDTAPYNDWVVTGNDALSIYSNIQSNDKTICKVYKTHSGLPDSWKTKKIIERSLNNKSLSSFWYRCSN